MSEPDEHIEIADPPRRRWAALARYALICLGVAIVLVVLFLQLAAPLALTAALVLFMVGYMGLMAWVAEGKLDRRE